MELPLMGSSDRNVRELSHSNALHMLLEGGLRQRFSEYVCYIRLYTHLHHLNIEEGLLLLIVEELR